MKEFSVSFYKKLIVFILALIFLAALFFSGLAIKAYLDYIKHDKIDDGQNREVNGEQISSGNDIDKLVEKAKNKKNKLREQKNDNSKDNNKIGLNDKGNQNSKLNQDKNSNDIPYVEPDKVVYLTFEDGASRNTNEILSILQENNVNATFFFNVSERKSSDEIIKKAFLDGNTIGVLTSINGSLSQVYATAQDYGRDIDQSSLRIENITGEKPTVLRFPGGSKNPYIGSRTEEFVNEANKRGMVYFDWNLCAEGNGQVKDLESLVANATKIKQGTNRYILLMHDNGNPNSCTALRRVIQFYKNEGFEFMPLSSSVKPIVF